EIFLKKLLGGAANTQIRPIAIEYMIAIERNISAVMANSAAAAAPTTAMVPASHSFHVVHIAVAALSCSRSNPSPRSQPTYGGVTAPAADWLTIDVGFHAAPCRDTRDPCPKRQWASTVVAARTSEPPDSRTGVPALRVGGYKGRRTMPNVFSAVASRTTSALGMPERSVRVAITASP